jgi:hypothetical protein
MFEINKAGSNERESLPLSLETYWRDNVTKFHFAIFEKGGSRTWYMEQRSKLRLVSSDASKF